jgi:hypothetical protein
MPCDWSGHFLTAASQQLPTETLPEIFGALQVLQSAYHQGHISATTQAELTPHASSPIIFISFSMSCNIFVIF